MNIKMAFLACVLFATLQNATPSSFPSDYVTFAEMEGELKAISQTHSDIAMLRSIGESLEGRPIYALKISDFPTKEEDEPDVLYVSEHHARESITVVITMEWIRYLVNNYGDNPDVTALVDSREIWVVPMMNPDGHIRVERGDKSWRANARGVDLNRNYDYRWGYDNIGSSPLAGEETYRGSAPFSEPETEAIRNLVNNHNFVTAISYHSGTNLTLYPWRYIAEHTPHNDLFRAIGETIEDIAGYQYGDSADGVLYTSNGSFNDWAYAKGIIAITIEVYGKNSSDLWQYFNPSSFDIVPKNIEAARFMADIADDPQRAFIFFSLKRKSQILQTGEEAEFIGMIKNNHPQRQTFVLEGSPGVIFSEKSFTLSLHETKTIVVTVKLKGGKNTSDIKIYSRNNQEIKNTTRLVIENGGEIPLQFARISVQPQSDSAKIFCETTIETYATLLYGTDALDMKIESNALQNEHSFSVTDLQQGKKYFYMIIAKDAFGSTKESDVSSFATKETMPPQTGIAEKEEGRKQEKVEKPTEIHMAIIFAVMVSTLGVLALIAIRSFRR